jgi:hypothetical protein
MTLLGAGVLTLLLHCTLLSQLSVHGDRNELVPLHVLELHDGVTFLRSCTQGSMGLDIIAPNRFPAEPPRIFGACHHSC